jgi:hypothetical protein
MPPRKGVQIDLKVVTLQLISNKTIIG